MGRRIGGKGGGSDPARKGSAPLIVITILFALSASGLSAGGSTAMRSSSSSSSRPSANERSNENIQQQRIQRIRNRLERKNLDVEGEFQSDGAACTEHSYGQVNTFFLQQLCTALHRAQFEIKDRAGNVALVAISWVEMPDLESARAYKELVDTHGTGNVIELSREEGPYQTVRYTGYTYASRRNGTVVVNAQAEPVTRGWRGVALATVVTHAAR